jgi:hypothetical protein
MGDFKLQTSYNVIILLKIENGLAIDIVCN